MGESLKKRAEEIFIESQELEGNAQSEFIDDACAGNDGLRLAVHALLDAATASEDYFDDLSSRLGIAQLLDDALQEDAAFAKATWAAVEPGEQLGHYTLTNPIGRGGMGSVWSAERSDGRFEGRVAIKLLDVTAGTAAMRRFGLEAQYLAKLAHPNIAHLFDAGVKPNGQPYLVLEYVDGVSIDKYSDASRLDVNARIRLVLDVLAAVTHAHSHLIVHRDLKPSNILVTEEGAVKLLDFGVAKLLQTDPAGAPSSGLTREVGAALTPEYAAPEQLLGAATTTASDVYAIGLILYELLSGGHPRRSGEIQSFMEWQATALSDPPGLWAGLTRRMDGDEATGIAESRQTTVVALQRILRNDLDKIVRKALATEPRERYATAADLASDLRRYLRNEPVTARADTIRYRASKFVRRHRGGVLAGTLTMIALIGATVITSWQSVEARRQRDVAIYQQQRVLASNEFLMLLLGEVGPEGKPLTVVELLDRGVGMLDRNFGKEYRFLGRMLFDLASAYFSLGNTSKMLDLLDRAEEVGRQYEDGDLVAAVLCARARIRVRSEPEQSKAEVEEANALLADIATPSIDSFSACARANAQVVELDGDRQAAINLLQTSLETLNSSQLSSVQGRILMMNQLTNLYHNQGEGQLALTVNKKLLELMEETGRGETVGYLINSLNRSVFLQSMGEFRSALEIREGLLGRVRELQQVGQAPISFLSFYASSLMHLGQYDEALAIGIEAYEAAQAAGNESWAAQDELQLGRILMRMGRFEQAEGYLDSAESTFRRASTSNDRLIQAVVLARASVLLGRGDRAGAGGMVEAELARLDYPNQRIAPGLGSALRIGAKIALANEDAATAEAYASDYHDIAVQAARDEKLSANVGYALLLRAKARLLLDKEAAARDDLRLARDALANGLGPEHPDTRESGRLLEDVGGG